MQSVIMLWRACKTTLIYAYLPLLLSIHLVLSLLLGSFRLFRPLLLPGEFENLCIVIPQICRLA